MKTVDTVAIAIKTIPDIEAGKRLYAIQNLSDAGVAKAMLHLQQQKSGSENLPHYLQKLIMIAICYQKDGDIQTKILSGENLTEKALLEEYASLVVGKQQLTWRGTQFEFPVLRYRALKVNVDLGDLTQQIDISSNLSLDCVNNTPSLYEISSFLELPKLSKDSASHVWDAWQDQAFDDIRATTVKEAENVHKIFLMNQLTV